MESIREKMVNTLKSLPPVTLGTVLLCCATFAVQVLVEFIWHISVESLGCLSPYQAVQKFQLWRVVTHGLIHTSLAHLVLNSIAAVQLGYVVERKAGSREAMMKILASALIVESLLYIAMSYGLDGILLLIGIGKHWRMSRHCVAGLSGVLFALLVLVSGPMPLNLDEVRNAAKVSLYGVVGVPKFAMPWILLAFIQIVLPQASLLGYLCGIMAGYGLIYTHADGVYFSSEREPLIVGVL